MTTIPSTIRIEAPHFVAAVDLKYDSRRIPPSRVVTFAAPILRYMQGWTEARVHDYCASKGWRSLLLDPHHGALD